MEKNELIIGVSEQVIGDNRIPLSGTKYHQYKKKSETDGPKISKTSIEKIWILAKKMRFLRSFMRNVQELIEYDFPW